MRLAIKADDGSWSLPQVKRAEGLHPTAIGWCDFSANVIRAIDTQTGKIGWHCDPQSPACANCYAEAINKFVGTGLEYRREHFDSGRVKVELDMQRINAILNYRIPKGFVGKAGDGRPKVFWNDMTDGFGEFVPVNAIHTMIAVAAIRRDMDHLILTKRVERMSAVLSDPGTMTSVASAMWQLGHGDESMSLVWPLPNLWIGATVENQRQADIRIPKLRECPASVRFVSVEPLLGEIEFWQEMLGRTGDSWTTGLNWVILGCESDGKRTGRFADEYHDAAASVINQCRAAGVAVFHKQWPHEGKVATDLATLPERMRLRQWPKARVA